MTSRLSILMIVGALVPVAAPAQSPAKGDPAKARPIVEKVCSSCHGTDGNSPAPPNPSLAGQHPEYLYKQLLSYKSQGNKPPERNNALMTGMVANLTTDDMSNLAAYFASQKPAARVARDPKLVSLGQSIYRGGIMSKGVAACASCHAPNGAGIPAQFPRIAGQHAEYTEAQLKAFRVAERTNDPNRMMRIVAAKLSDVEIKALAEYIGGLR